MGWIKTRPRHQCLTPRAFNIWLHLAGEGAVWECPECSQRWVLHFPREMIDNMPYVWRKDPNYLPKRHGPFRPNISDVFRDGDY